MCDCIEQINPKLAANNAKLSLAHQLTGNTVRSRIMVALERVDKSKRKALPTLVASYCPFCGEKWAAEASGG